MKRYPVVKTVMFSVLLLLTLLIAGCSESENTPLTGAVVSEVKAQPKTEISQPAPQITCKDECNTSTCKGYKFVECEKQADGCQHKTEALTVGKCGIQCLSDKDCDTNHKCSVNYECKTVEIAPLIAKVSEKVCEPNKRICDNLKILQCNSEGTEYAKVDICKVRCSEGKCYADTTTQTASSSLQELRDSLQDLSNKLADTTRINKKIDDCSIICAGKQANIPAVKDQFYLACYQFYYYAGEAELDKFMVECK